MVLILLVLCVVGVLTSSVPSNKMLYNMSLVENYFEEFISEYNKEYKSEIQRKMRFEIFKSNLESINRKNMQVGETATFGINQFTDMTSEEFRTAYLTHLPEAKVPCSSNRYFPTNLTAPASWDWRQQNLVTRVKAQGTCGSCWAFSTVGNLEGQYAKKYRQLQEFSEQQLVDCSLSNRGCDGGWINVAIQDLMQMGGIMGEQDYPYVNSQSQCQFNPAAIRAKVTNCYNLPFSSEEELKGILVENGPIAFAVDATDFKSYHGGVLGSCRPGQPNHAVLLVGYGTEGGIPYWLIKNSWSEQWGESGYIRVQLGINSCNMQSTPFTTGEVA